MTGAALRPAIRRSWPPWRWPPLHPCAVPGMISGEEAKYYRWVGRYYAGAGAVIELGCWLGRSTSFILAGLRRNRAFAGRQLHVVDDFVWRSDWMDRHYPGDPPANRASFRALFDAYTAPVRDTLAVRAAKIVDYDGNEALSRFVWNEGPVELLFVDCGRTLDVNEGWFSELAPSLLPGRSLVVLQDWGTWRELPPRPYNQTRQFTDAHADVLRLVHEVSQGTLATFLYLG